MDLVRTAVKPTRAAEMMDITVDEVRNMIKEGRLRTCGSGSGIRVTTESMRPFLSDPSVLIIRYPTKRKMVKSGPLGYIYLVQCGRYYKIGLTRDVQQRMQALKNTVPGDVQLLHTIPTNDLEKAEAQLHEQFKDKRTNGEWFLLNKKDVATIREYKSLFLE